MDVPSMAKNKTREDPAVGAEPVCFVNYSIINSIDALSSILYSVGRPSYKRLLADS